MVLSMVVVVEKYATFCGGEVPYVVMELPSPPPKTLISSTEIDRPTTPLLVLVY